MHSQIYSIYFTADREMQLLIKLVVDRYVSLLLLSFEAMLSRVLGIAAIRSLSLSISPQPSPSVCYDLSLT